MTTTLRRRCAAAVAALGLAAALAGCSVPTDSAEPVAGQSSEDGATSAAVDHNDADTEFAQAMIVHHEGAVEMAELALERASDERVRDLAERIAEAQGPEIELMSGWLDAWGEDRSAGGGHGGMDHGAMEMDGMDQDEAMASLAELDGARFDRRFLELMVDHHRGAIEMAETHRDEGLDAEARDLGRRIITDQSSEITEMEQLLDDL